MKITLGNVAINLFVTIVSALVAAYLVDYFQIGATDKLENKRPPIIMTYAAIEVPSTANKMLSANDLGIANPADDVKNVINFLSFGFTVVEYEVGNPTEKLQRDVELRIPNDVTYVFAGSTAARLDLSKAQHFDLEPNSKMKFLAIQRYQHSRLAVAVGDEYFNPIDTKQYTADIQAAQAVAQVEQRNFLVPTIVFWPIFAGLASIIPLLIPLVVQLTRGRSVAPVEISTTENPRPAQKRPTKETGS